MWPLMTSLERTAVRREVAAAAAASGKLINSASARIQQLFSDVQRFVTSHLATCCRHDEKDIFISGWLIITSVLIRFFFLVDNFDVRWLKKKNCLVGRVDDQPSGWFSGWHQLRMSPFLCCQCWLSRWMEHPCCMTRKRCYRSAFLFFSPRLATVEASTKPLSDCISTLFALFPPPAPLRLRYLCYQLQREASEMPIKIHFNVPVAWVRWRG